MTEKLLHYIWQFGYYNKSGLTTVVGDPLHIQFAGQYNQNQGADFLDAKVKIDKVLFAGSVELHLKTSDWKKHKHTGDANYNNVVLHVVWQHDEQETDLPVLELKGKVSSLLLNRYEALMQSSAFIPCEKLIGTIKAITWTNWKERLLVERLLRKSSDVEKQLRKNNYHWEEAFWWQLARNFGIKVNADAFEVIAQSISINILAKHKTQVQQLEALLLGQAGLLKEKFAEDYPILLQKEYKFLQEKYALKSINQPVHFLRMRPGNFPTVRMAQLAMLIHHSAHLFSKIKEAKTVKELRQMFAVTANDYWHYHYKLDAATKYKPKHLGDAMIDNIIINTIVPVLFAYGKYHDDTACKQKALYWLQQLAPEQNTITKGFKAIGIENKTSYDSQALIELKNNYCHPKRCLQCSVGNGLLNLKE